MDRTTLRKTGVEELEQAARLRALENELEGYGALIGGGCRDFGMAERIAHLEQVLEWERAPEEVLGLALGGEWAGRPWAGSAQLEGLLERLAQEHVCLGHTDHLGDAALWEVLTGRLLEDVKVRPLLRTTTLYIVNVDMYARDPEAIYLKYYATAAERRQWAEDTPFGRLPRRKRRTRARDRRLQEMVERYRPMDAQRRDIDPLKRLVLYSGEQGPLGQYGVINLC